VRTERRTALIVYDGLPISSGGGHTLRTKDRHAPWTQVRHFLDRFTTCDTPADVRLLLAEGSHVDADFFESAKAAFYPRDPLTGETLPGQGIDLYGGQEAAPKLILGQSKIYLRLITQLEGALPFPLSTAAWSRWRLNRQGTRYYKRRLDLSANA